MNFCTRTEGILEMRGRAQHIARSALQCHPLAMLPFSERRYIDPVADDACCTHVHVGCTGAGNVPLCQLLEYK